MPVLAIGLSVVFLGIFRLMSRFSKHPNTRREDAIVAIRYVLGVVLALAGLEKLTGINDIIGPPAFYRPENATVLVTIKTKLLPKERATPEVLSNISRKMRKQQNQIS